VSEAEQAPTVRYCGRDFSADELNEIRVLLKRHPEYNRAELSRQVCDLLNWRRPDGRRKDMSCRVAMLRLERAGLLTLPPPTSGNGNNGNGRLRPRLTAASEPREPVALPAGELGVLQFRIVEARTDSRLWNELVQRYHYLGYQPLPGAQLRYLVFSGNDCTDWTHQPPLLAALGFGAAAWKRAPRDDFLGWTAEQRLRNLPLVVNNARFLILPWITSPNLASRVLSALAKQIPADWELRYGYRPLLLETSVERDRFQGTAYRAANWRHGGQTQGRGKLDTKHLHALPVKDAFLYPLHRHRRFRQLLCR